jgi:hypothetical protein
MDVIVIGDASFTRFRRAELMEASIACRIGRILSAAFLVCGTCAELVWGREVSMSIALLCAMNIDGFYGQVACKADFSGPFFNVARA